MLTDEEKRAIRARVASGDWHFDLMKFANEIERAVLAKAMPIPKQEPAWVSNLLQSAMNSGDEFKGYFTLKPSEVIHLINRPQPAQQSSVVAVDGKSNDRGEPEALYLQLHGEEFQASADFRSGETTWCWEKIHDSDVRYIRADLVPQSPAVAVPDNWRTLDHEDFDLVLDWLKQQELKINVGQVQGDFDEYVRSSAGELLSLIESARDYFKSIAIKSPSITTEPKLDKPARVNATNFMTGVPVRMVIEAAQRYYEWRQENPPEKDSEMQKKFFSAIYCIKKPSISTEQLLEIAASAIASVQSFTGLAANHAQRWLENEGVELVEKLSRENGQ